MNRFEGYGRTEVTLAGELISIESHLAAILASLPQPEPIELPLIDALGMTLIDDFVSQIDLPAFANSAMDGFAVVAADLAEASLETPIALALSSQVMAGDRKLPVVSSGGTVGIMTGAPVPPGANAVVAVETTIIDGSSVSFIQPVGVGSNIRHIGEDLFAGKRLAFAGKRLTPARVAVLAAAGITTIRCVRPPRVVILSSGDELVPSAEIPRPGQVRDANGPMLSALVKAAGGVPFFAGIVRDDREALVRAFDMHCGNADLFISTGGASAGIRDLIPEAIASLGESVSVKVAMKPGMPQVRGRIGQVPVIGLPGNPVSSFVSFELFVRPAIRALQGQKDLARPQVTATAAEVLKSPPNKRGFIRVALAHRNGRWVATPTGSQHSHLLSSIAGADGLAEVPESVTQIAAGSDVRVHLLDES
ncbi:MAG: gephyrin-like molybdotransferase Glp [Nitriliruptoraceae bacterium]